MHRELYYLSAFMESTSYALPRLLILRAGAGNSYLPPNSKSVGLPAILISHSHVEASHHRARRASVRLCFVGGRWCEMNGWMVRGGSNHNKTADGSADIHHQYRPS